MIFVMIVLTVLVKGRRHSLREVGVVVARLSLTVALGVGVEVLRLSRDFEHADDADDEDYEVSGC